MWLYANFTGGNMFGKSKQGFINWQKVTLALAALALIWTQKAHALEFADDKLEIHGYGHQGFLLANHNKYLGATNDGTFDYNALALLFSVKATDDLTIWAQLFGTLNDFRVDWAFVDYRVNDNLQIRAGQIKTPIGIYNEIRDIKYLQLSTLEPLIYQEDLNLAHEAFRGGSALYNHDVAGGNVAVDVYGGQFANFEDNSDLSFSQTIGGRVTYKTPVEGLSFMGSGYTSKVKMTEGTEVSNGRNNLLMGSVNYEAHGIDLKAEYADAKHHDVKRRGYYVQGGYTFFDKLTPFVRYDSLITDKDQKHDPSFYQKDFCFGVGYKFNSFVAAKIEDHLIHGYALPVVTGEVAEGEGIRNWNLFAASINFMF
jgi:hypothetical protein